MIIRKSRKDLQRMADAGVIVARSLGVLRDAVRPQMTTGELDRIAEDYIVSQGGVPTFKGYHGFTGSICASLNDMIVHGIPGPEVVLDDGDIISLDVGVTYRGWVADSALTVAVGDVSADALRLLEACQASLHDAIPQCVAGNHLSDIGHAIQNRAEGAGFAVVRTLVGHGVGRRMHEDPQIPNYGPPGRGPELRDGMVFAIEPMITAGTHEVELDEDDGWSITTADGSLAAHFEHTVAVTEDGPLVLTRDGGWSPVDEPIGVATG